MKISTIATAALMVAMALPAGAQTFTAENRVKVIPQQGQTFLAKEDRRDGVPGQWCAAADYAVRVLGAGWSQPIYVRGNSGRDVLFGMTSGGATPSRISSISASARTPGATFSVQRAFAICIDLRQPDYLSR